MSILNNHETPFPDLEGKVFISPTDTIIGLGALSSNNKAIDKMSQIKNRPKEKSFLLLVEDFHRLKKLVNVSPLHEYIILNSERPTTIVYNEIINVPKYLLREDGTVAIRMITEPSISSMIRYFDQPIASTSANISGMPSPTRFSEIDQEIISKVDFIHPMSYDFIPFHSASIILRVVENRVEIIRS